MAEEDVAVAVAASEAPEPSPVSSDHKRKLEDLEPQEQEASETLVATSSSPSSAADPSPQDLNGNAEEADEKAENFAPEVKRPRLEQEPESDGSVLENGHQVEKEENADAPPKVENPEVDNGERVDAETEGEEHRSVENPETGDVSQPSSDNDVKPEDGQQALESDDRQPEDGGFPLQGDVSAAQPQDESESQTTSRKMEVPNNKVGVLIGKAGETIRLLQYNSGAKIQITRDSEADVYSSTRPVELIGTPESINKAEKLIKDVIAEADAGGSPSLVARGFGTVQASGAAEQIQIQVPNEKVGLIIGKGGETIKNLQTRSGARIQLIPQHLPEGDQSKERTVRVTGDKKEIEIAREMIKDVMNQVVRPSHHSGGGYNQQSHRPRGPNGPPQWGPRTPPTAQPTGYNYHHQRGMYPSHQNPQYQPSSYGGYPPQQPNPRGSFNAGWDQRPSGPVHGTQGGGYDYYSQGGHMPDASASNPASNALATSAAAGAPPSQVNYNYGQPQGPDYGQPMPYSQSAHPQQGYGHGYDDPKYANQVSAQPTYGGHGNPQPGAYSQANTQPGYGQQPYARPPAYGMQSQGPPQAYGPPRPTQPGEMPYQNLNPATHPYGQTAPAQQAYPYASGGPAQQQPYPYGSAPAADGYNQPQSLAAPGPGYPQQSAQSVPGYAQPGSQVAQGYAQSGQPGGGYGPAYSSSQQGYSEQPASNAPGYGYQAPADGGYGNAPTAAYNAAQSGHTGYAQPPANQQGYEQQAMAQAGGYGSVPAAAPPGYVKNVSPQPGYAATQYDSTQMYGGHH